MSNDIRSRGWLLTQSAEKMSQEELQNLLCNYTYIGQREKGEQGGENGYEHFQIYIENKNPIKFSSLKKKLPNAYCEVRRGSRQQVYDYVTKSATKIGETFGNGEINLKEEQGKRSDFLNIVEFIQNDIPLAEIEQMFPTQFIMYRKHIEQTYQVYLRQKMNKRASRREGIEIIYIYGGTGSGKTSYVLDKHGDENVCIMCDYPYGSNNRERFDDYEGQKVLLFDEFRSQIKLTNMLRYLDKYFCTLPARYGNKIAVYDKVYIVSNWTLEEQYKNIQETHPGDWEAFKRRITKIYHFKRDNEQSKICPVYDSSCDQMSMFDSMHVLSDEEAGNLPF